MRAALDAAKRIARNWSLSMNLSFSFQPIRMHLSRARSHKIDYRTVCPRKGTLN